ncbi:MAG: sugar phosphate nucleotidyltransferase [Eubacteriales bacterium]|nr:sugar phosphate nucleotidyltransferase [Eubacteriales bacterium]
MATSKTSCVILAGGKGERLYPITLTRPKPLCPVGNATCLTRCILAAKNAGVDDITVAACYLADKIKKEVSSFENVKVKRETTMLGTAGCVRKCAVSGDDVLVLSGDGVNDFDLKSLIEYHKKAGFICTVAITRSPYPTEYGVVTAKEGIVRRFNEKPGWEKVTSDTVNTGIYVLSRQALSFIPRNRFFDFSNDLFPLLMKKGYDIAAWESAGFWCDIGNPKALYDCSMRYTGDRSAISPSAVVKEDASVNASIVMENVVIGKRAVIDSSIICENVKIGDNVLIPKGCVIGGNAQIGEGAVLSEGITVTSGAVIGKGGRILKDVRFGGVKGRLFDGDEGINGIYGETFDLSDGVAFGKALCEAAGNGRDIKIGVMYAPTAHSRLLGESISGGIRYAGAVFCDLGEGFSSLCGFCAKEYYLDFSVFAEVKNDLSLSVQVYDTSWSPIRGKTIKSIESSFYRGGSKAAPFPSPPIVPEKFEAPLYLYSGALLSRGKGLAGMSFAVDLANLPGKVLLSTAEKLGAAVSNDASVLPRISVTDDGRGLDIITESGKTMDFWQILCFYLGVEAEYKKIIYIPEDTPAAATEYAVLKGSDCRRCTESRDPGKDFDPCFRDGCFLGISVLEMLSNKGMSFDEMAASIPEFYIRTVTGEYDEAYKASKIRKLCDECGREDGARFVFDKGSVRFIPSSHKGFRIISEAASSEYAQELCDFALEKLKD